MNKEEHNRLVPDCAVYQFFDEAFGLINSNMKQTFERLVQNSYSSSNVRENQGFIDWSAIPGLNATGLTSAINNTVDLVVNHVRSRNDQTAWVTVSYLEGLMENIVEYLRTVVQTSQTVDQRGHAVAIDLWSTALQTIANARYR